MDELRHLKTGVEGLPSVGLSELRMARESRCSWRWWIHVVYGVRCVMPQTDEVSARGVGIEMHAACCVGKAREMWNLPVLSAAALEILASCQTMSWAGGLLLISTIPTSYPWEGPVMSLPSIDPRKIPPLHLLPCGCQPICAAPRRDPSTFQTSRTSTSCVLASACRLTSSQAAFFRPSTGVPRRSPRRWGRSLAFGA
jgi:hypothetical protein